MFSSRGLEQKTPIVALPVAAVALLDVDHTLIGKMDFFTDIHRTKLAFEQSCEVNASLLASLKSSGIRQVYLFTDMNASFSDIFFRFMLVKYLKSEGFNVNGVVTPPDIFINRASEEQLLKMEESFKKQTEGKGKLSEQGQQALNAEQRAIAVNLLQENERGPAPGVMFDLALKKYLGDANYNKYQAMTFQQLLESDFQSNVQGEFAQYIQENSAELTWLKVKVDHLKGLADNAIQGQHSKGLMFKELVIQKNIQKVFYADDHVGAVESVRRQAQAMPNVGTSICYIPRADKSRDPAYRDAYYELRDEHYDFAAQSAQDARPGMLTLMNKAAVTISKAMDRKAAVTISKVYDEVLKMTKHYNNQEREVLEEKDPVLTGKKRLIKKLQAELESTGVSKSECLVKFTKMLVSENHDILNKHRTDTWKRYISNALSVLTVLPFLGRLAHSYYKYSTVKFWKPESEKVKMFALSECAKLKINIS